MPFLSSSRSRNQSSHLIDDNIRDFFPENHSIRTLVLWKQTKKPAEHEFVILTTDDAEGTCYRVERRPSVQENLSSKVQGCAAEDTITPLERDQAKKLLRSGTVARQITVHFRANPKPDLYTVFSFCNALRKDPDAEQYTLMLFNCYFFARTLTLLISRHFSVRQYCQLYKSERKGFGHRPGPEIDKTLDKWVPETLMRVKIDKCADIIEYQTLRWRINEMNKEHCKTVNLLPGWSGDDVLKYLVKRYGPVCTLTRVMRKTMSPTWTRVSLDPYSVSEELLLPLPSRRNDTSCRALSRHSTKSAFVAVSLRIDSK